MSTKRRLGVGLIVLGLSISGLTAQANTLEVKVSLTNFSNSTTKALSASQKRQIQSFLSANPLTESLTCIGFKHASRGNAGNRLAIERAGNACNYAKTIGGKLLVTYESKTTNSKSMHGRVSIVAKISQATTWETLLLYRVMPGDSLVSIAQKFNVETSAIQSQNKMGNSMILRVGQNLLIPKSQSNTAVPSASPIPSQSPTPSPTPTSSPTPSQSAPPVPTQSPSLPAVYGPEIYALSHGQGSSGYTAESYWVTGRASLPTKVSFDWYDCLLEQPGDPSWPLTELPKDCSLRTTSIGVPGARNSAGFSSTIPLSALNPQRHTLVVARGENSSGSTQRISRTRSSTAPNTEWVFSRLSQRPNSIGGTEYRFEAVTDGRQDRLVYKYQWFRCTAPSTATSQTLPPSCSIRKLAMSDNKFTNAFSLDNGFYLLARVTAGSLVIYSQTTDLIQIPSP